MDTLNIDEIEESAATRLEVAKKAKELALLVTRVFPGYGVYIERRSRTGAAAVSPNGHKGSLADLSGTDQIETVLEESGKPMFKHALLSEIKNRGGTLNLDTLTSYLSRYEQFVSKGKGMWDLDKSRKNSRHTHEKAGSARNTLGLS